MSKNESKLKLEIVMKLYYISLSGLSHLCKPLFCKPFRKVQNPSFLLNTTGVSVYKHTKAPLNSAESSVEVESLPAQTSAIVKQQFGTVTLKKISDVHQPKLNKFVIFFHKLRRDLMQWLKT